MKITWANSISPQGLCIQNRAYSQKERLWAQTVGEKKGGERNCLISGRTRNTVLGRREKQ